MNTTDNTIALTLRAKRKLREKGYTFNSSKELVEYISQNKDAIKEAGLSDDEITALKETVRINKEAEKHYTSGGIVRAKKGEGVTIKLEAIEGLENMTQPELHDLLYED